MTRCSVHAALVMATFLSLTAVPALAQRGDAPGSASQLSGPTSGEQVYRQVCQACHMADAQGATGAAAIPALAANPRLAASAYPIAMVVHGRGAMPGFTDLLTPAQMADVVGYVRTHFGNNYPKPVTEADVAQVVGAK